MRPTQFNWAKNLKPDKAAPALTTGILVKIKDIQSLEKVNAVSASSSRLITPTKRFSQAVIREDDPKWTLEINQLISSGKISQALFDNITLIADRNKTDSTSVPRLSMELCMKATEIRKTTTNEIGGIVRTDKILGWEGTEYEDGVNNNYINNTTLLIGHTHNSQEDPGMPWPPDLDISADDKRKPFVHMVCGLRYLATYINGNITGFYNITNNRDYFISMGHLTLESRIGEKAANDGYWIKNKQTGNYTSYYILIGTDGKEYYFGDKSFDYKTKGIRAGGGIGSTEGSEPQETLVLLDDNGTAYSEDQLSFMWQNFTGADGKKRLPKIWEFNDDGTVKTEGAKLVFGYLNNDYQRPIITGCLENLGAQHTLNPAFNSSIEVPNREVDNNYNDDFKVTRTVSPEGDMIIELENLNDKAVKYHLNVKGGKSEVYINSEGNTYIGNDKNQIQFDGDKIFIGSRSFAGKAKEVGINAERIILGNSSFYFPEIKTDAQLNNLTNESYTSYFTDAADLGSKPKIQHQWAVLGETLVHLLGKMIEIWYNTKYQGGSTICTVSFDDKQKMIRDVYTKLPFVLSSNISLVNKDRDPKPDN